MYLKELHKKWGKTQKCLAKERSSSTEREAKKKNAKTRKKERKLREKNVDSLTLGHNGGCN